MTYITQISKGKNVWSFTSVRIAYGQFNFIFSFMEVDCSLILLVSLSKCVNAYTLTACSCRQYLQSISFGFCKQDL